MFTREKCKHFCVKKETGRFIFDFDAISMSRLHETKYFYRLLRGESIRFDDFARKAAHFVRNEGKNYACAINVKL